MSKFGWRPFAFAFSLNAKWNKRDARGRFAKGSGASTGKEPKMKKLRGGSTTSPGESLPRAIREADTGSNEHKMAVGAYADYLEESGDEIGAKLARSVLAERDRTYGAAARESLLEGTGAVTVEGTTTTVHRMPLRETPKTAGERAALAYTLKHLKEYTWYDEGEQRPKVVVSAEATTIPEAWWVANGFQRQGKNYVWEPRFEVEFYQGPDKSRIRVPNLADGTLDQVRYRYETQHQTKLPRARSGTFPGHVVYLDGVEYASS